LLYLIALELFAKCLRSSSVKNSFAHEYRRRVVAAAASVISEPAAWW